MTSEPSQRVIKFCKEHPDRVRQVAKYGWHDSHESLLAFLEDYVE